MPRVLRWDRYGLPGRPVSSQGIRGTHLPLVHGLVPICPIHFIWTENARCRCSLVIQRDRISPDAVAFTNRFLSRNPLTTNDRDTPDSGEGTCRNFERYAAISVASSDSRSLSAGLKERFGRYAAKWRSARLPDTSLLAESNTANCPNHRRRPQRVCVRSTGQRPEHGRGSASGRRAAWFRCKISLWSGSQFWPCCWRQCWFC